MAPTLQTNPQPTPDGLYEVKMSLDVAGYRRMSEENWYFRMPPWAPGNLANKIVHTNKLLCMILYAVKVLEMMKQDALAATNEQTMTRQPVSRAERLQHFKKAGEFRFSAEKRFQHAGQLLAAVALSEMVMQT